MSPTNSFKHCTMPVKEIIDRKGRRFKWTEIEGHAWPVTSGPNVYFPQGPETQFKEIKKLVIKDDDVMICAYPKAGKSTSDKQSLCAVWRLKVSPYIIHFLCS